jgi:preprotein translocase subunit Sec63
MTSHPPSHYERLGVAPEATVQELRRAFRALSKRYHPDTTSLPAAEAEEAFRQLQQAYSVLADPVSRALYDRRLREPSPPPVIVPAPRHPSVAVAPPRPASVRRALSGGEWFALLLLGLAMVFSLLLGIGLAWARGTELVRQPSWWAERPAAVSITAPQDPSRVPSAG